MDIEQLLHEEEGTSLDFKSETYKFSGANDFQKSELLKDVLAFTNAWRRSTAYILLGVKEVKGGRSTPVGITEELDDAQLQEFINKKTQRPITFTYRTYNIDDVKIGIIEIPVQQRPAYITKDYGKLRRNIVPIRIGSSTSEASPDDVVKMAQAEIKQSIELPSLQVVMADIENETLLGSEITITPTVLDMSRFDEIVDFEDPKLTNQYLSSSNIPASLLNPFGETARGDYYRELAFYEYKHKKNKRISFAITNPSKVSVTDITVSIIINKNKSLFSIFPPSKLPDYPETHDRSLALHHPILHRDLTDKLIKKDNTFKFEELEGVFRINLTFRKVQPKQTIFCERTLCLEPQDSHSIDAKVIIYADNLPNPIESSLTITCKVKHETRLFEGLDTPQESHNTSKEGSGLLFKGLNIKVKKSD